MKLFFLLAVLGLGLSFIIGNGATAPRTLAEAPAPTLSPAEFTRLQVAIRPSSDEDAFDKIPWQVSIHEARVVAAKESKPILLWEMDGHPLGCG